MFLTHRKDYSGPLRMSNDCAFEMLFPRSFTGGDKLAVNGSQSAEYGQVVLPTCLIGISFNSATVRG